MWMNFYSFANFLWGCYQVDIVDFMNWGFMDLDSGSPEGAKPDVYKFGLYSFVLDHGTRGKGGKGGKPPSAEELAAPMLEVGCGHGGGLNGFHKRGYTDLSGLDFTPSNIGFCERKWGGKEGGPHFEVNNAVSFCPSPTEGPHAGKYSTILNIESSHCYPNFAAFLQMCHNALRPGGLLKMCDFRRKEQLEAILRDAEAGGQWEIASTRIITKEVASPHPAAPFPVRAAPRVRPPARLPARPIHVTPLAQVCVLPRSRACTPTRPRCRAAVRSGACGERVIREGIQRLVRQAVVRAAADPRDAQLLQPAGLRHLHDVRERRAGLLRDAPPQEGQGPEGRAAGAGAGTLREHSPAAARALQVAHQVALQVTGAASRQEQEREQGGALRRGKGAPMRGGKHQGRVSCLRLCASGVVRCPPRMPTPVAVAGR